MGSTKRSGDDKLTSKSQSPKKLKATNGKPVSSGNREWKRSKNFTKKKNLVEDSGDEDEDDMNTGKGDEDEEEEEIEEEVVFKPKNQKVSASGTVAPAQGDGRCMYKHITL